MVSACLHKKLAMNWCVFIKKIKHIHTAMTSGLLQLMDLLPLWNKSSLNSLNFTKERGFIVLMSNYRADKHESSINKDCAIAILTQQ